MKLMKAMLATLFVGGVMMFTGCSSECGDCEGKDKAMCPSKTKACCAEAAAAKKDCEKCKPAAK